MASPAQLPRLASGTSSLRSIFKREAESTKSLRASALDNTYVVENPVLTVEPTALLTTRLGTYLLKHHLMSSALYLICLICIVLFFVPLGQSVTYEANDRTGTLRTLERPHAVQTLMGSFFGILGMSLNAHQMNRQIFMTCALSFDFMVIVSSGLLIQTVWYINWYIVFARAGEWACEEVPVMIVEFVANMCFYVTIASMDCIKMRYTRKVAICSTIMASFLAEFVVVRFDLRYDNFFADETLDWWLISTTPDEIYISSKLQLMLFLGKATLTYAYGQPFCCLKPDYEVPGREVLARRVVRQLSHTLTPHSMKSNSAEFPAETDETPNTADCTAEIEAQASPVNRDENKEAEEKTNGAERLFSIAEIEAVI
mmetsp:Transcript_111264/g.197011  ORF Transcript_111264/g.197011 Transcript_111264/m.197011 type:complete len:371 (-) Transcript_111264:388-1500(-)